jgi:NADPH2:quinone reductase
MMAAMIPHNYPLTLGRDGSGVVAAVGTGVTHVAVGDEVVGHAPLMPVVQVGTVAEFVVLPAETVVRKPANISHSDAAAVPLAGTAALAAVEAVEPKPGDVVLVSGASGGVGSFAVQLLKAQGATVVATATLADAERVTALGADVVIDYEAGTVSEQVSKAYPDGVDALLDLVYLPQGPLLSVVRRGGKAASLLNALTEDALAGTDVTGVNVFAQPTHDVVAQLLDQVATGKLRVDVTEVLAFEDAGSALGQLGAGAARGKIVISVS